ncbi:DUF5134 domain-containing protein [Streptomyces sp. 900116325]
MSACALGGQHGLLGGGHWGAVLHTVMSVAMISMFWSWGTAVPAVLLAMVFTVGALCYVVAAVLVPESVTGATQTVDGHHVPITCYHAVMMVSMVWMAATTAAQSAAPTDASGSASSGMDMAGMTMPGMSTTSDASTVVVHGLVPGWLGWGCGALAVVFSAAALWHAWRGMQGFLVQRPLRQYANDLAGTAMATGMAIAFSQMASAPF